jgi:hypothetical protein
LSQYCYVIVLTDGDSCWTRALAKATSYPDEEVSWEEDNLSRLMRDGWRPVRETPMGGDAGYLGSLLVLERGSG